jgi:hypothetical protein
VTLIFFVTGPGVHFEVSDDSTLHRFDTLTTNPESIRYLLDSQRDNSVGVQNHFEKDGRRIDE